MAPAEEPLRLTARIDPQDRPAQLSVKARQHMVDTPTNPKDQVRAALATMRAGRSPADGNRAIRRILNQFGADSINDLREEHYAAVLLAVTIPSPADFYGTVTDVQRPTPTAPLPRPPIGRKNTHIMPARVRSPLTLALEAELAKTRAKTKRSVPNYVVNTGNASRSEDQADDVVREYPSGERVR